MNKEELQQLIEKVNSYLETLGANGGVKETCKVSNIDISKWEWPQGIAMYAMYRYYLVCGKKEVLDYISNWYDGHIAKGLPEDRNINTVSPLLTLCHLCKINPKKEYLDVIKDWAEYVINEFPRTEEGGLNHFGTGRHEIVGQLWDDTLYMTGLFLANAGVVLKEQKYIDEAEKQFLLHARFLADKKTGLWYHGWNFEGRHNFAEQFWGRGNCWITASIPDLIETGAISPSVCEYLKGVLEAQVKALASLQDESGLWHTVLDYEESYLEASCTAGFGYGILHAVRMGILDKKYLIIGQKALDGIINCIDEDGGVDKVSYGTDVGTREQYMAIPICKMPYGQALSILLLIEGCYLVK